jgi:hypothetical protein
MTYIIKSNRQDSVFAYFSYVFSAYVLVVLVVVIFGIIKKIKKIIYSNPYGKRYLGDIEYRSALSLYQGVFINLIYTIFSFVTSWIYASVWLGTIAVYYLSLSSIRFLLLRSIRRIAALETNEKVLANELHSYRTCGYMMFLLNVAMTGMVIQMIWQNKGYAYHGYIIYMSAAYTFYCLIISIINIVKFRKSSNIILSATKALNFARALMSVLVLQTAMLEQFGSDDATFRRVMNTVTGSGVLIIVFTMAMTMVIQANKKLKRLQINNS